MVIKAVVFDMGGVLIPNAAEFMRDFEQEKGFVPGSISSTFSGSEISEYFKALEKGEITAEDYDLHFTRFYNKEHGTNMETIPVATSVTKYFSGINMIPEMEEIIKDLREAGCPTVLLTNNFYVDRAHRLPTLPAGFSELFDLVVESCRVGLRKPDKAIYQHVCQRLKVEPMECVFLDDLEPNVKSAKELGFITIKVTSTIQAVSELKLAVKEIFELRQGATCCPPSS